MFERLRRTVLVSSFVLAVQLLTSALWAKEGDLKGFLQDETTQQREWEQKLRAVPRPENLRKYMRIITEEPHIAGLPQSKKVAEYILSQFQSWGLNAWIEETQALMLLPTERYLELLEPET